MTKRTQLKEIVRCCELCFNRGSAFDWKHSDFLDLNKEIFEVTSVNISANTLKRIFGKIAMDDEYIPQRATIDALKLYGGYSDNQISENENNNVAKLPVSKKKSKELVYSLVIIAIIISLLVSFYLKKPFKLVGNIKLISTEGILPSTTFFKAEVPKSADSIFINYGDKSPLLYVNAGIVKSAHNYLFPGVYHVSLQTRNKVISSISVSVRSNKWVGLGFYRQADLPKKYFAFPVEKSKPDSLFHITNSQLSGVGLDTAGSFFTRLSNYTDIGEYSDSFNFEATFKNMLRKGIYCGAAQFQISGSVGMIRFKLVNEGCSSYVLNVLSEQSFDGKVENLSKFVVDLEKWNTIKIINQNKRVSVIVNGKKIFDGIYQQSIGTIKGLYVEFAGNGYVKKCDLSSLDGKLLYHF